MSDDRLEYAYEAARLQAAQRTSVVVDAFLDAIAERAAPDDIVALLEKVGVRLIELDVMFDGPPSHEAGRFIDCHNAQTGEGVHWGEWLDNGDRSWSLIGRAILPNGKATT